ncbi:HAMP domain-containing sensor histidine kinase [Caloramator sp. CAR-1]|uniref:sensor histidine kinase n=1 Tax=Caloramator sp. CAR-1 TaxID=3062777 RepID=UPI0026E2ADF1|nr:HAMP domain-containing sensor histidine kinase [Caloramator sp. CAR-1]MDO6354159.1 HAMP domain-containing sensor histidine kinase [Caloramator sp. CAR-1]
MTGIKKRWVKDYIIGIIVILIVFNLSFALIIRNYYYSSLRQLLINKVNTSTEFFNRYFTDKEKITFLLKNYVEDYSFDEDFIIQVWDTKGKVLFCSSGLNYAENLQSDYILALQDKVHSSIYINNITMEKLIAASAPIKVDGSIVGVLRIITSLREVDSRIKYYITFAIFISFVLVIFLFILSLTFSKSIIEPIKDINEVAKKMARGNFDVKITTKYNDEIRELAETLNYMANEIKRMQNLKSEFISSVSHELRTPLTSIKGWSETILTSDFDDLEEVKQGLKIITKEVDRLSDMVEDLLDFSKLEGGKIKLSLENFRLNQEIHDICNLYKGKANNKGLKITEELDENDIILADKFRIRQVIINLIDNAVKFSKQDGSILIRTIREKHAVKIIVEDDGIGIPIEKIDKVKEKFYKIDIKKEGSGLGLAICDEIIRLHKGDIVIESNEGLGTKVTIYLPQNEVS